MPLVVVQYKAERIMAGRTRDDLIEKLAQEIPNIVVPALHVPERGEAHLVPTDIGVWVCESSALDVNTKDLEIIIWANQCPERLANLEERKEIIVDGVRRFLADYDRNISGSVWVLLQPGAFGFL